MKTFRVQVLMNFLSEKEEHPETIFQAIRIIREDGRVLEENVEI